MPKPPKVAVMLGLANVANRMILAGVRRFLGADSPWDVSLEVAYSGPEWLSSSQWGGVLFLPSYPEMKSIIRRMSVPVVIVRGSSGEFNLPWVDSDDAGIGLIGATHLMERGFCILRQSGFRLVVPAAESLPGHAREKGLFSFQLFVADCELTLESTRRPDRALVEGASETRRRNGLQRQPRNPRHRGMPSRRA